MNKHKAMPNIRFKGFEDEWKEKKFSTLVNRKSHITSDSSLLSVEYENISPDNHEIHKNFNNKKGIFFQKGDILFGKLRPYLKKYFLAFYEGKAVGDFWVLSPKKDIYSRFAFYLIQTHKFYVVSNLSSGTKMPRSDWNLVSNSFFYVCNIEEQQKIGNFFAKLDKLLDLQQQKINKLELLKKALLQKLFPKHDTKIPELRFKGFEDEWKSYLLGKIAVFINGRAFKQNELLDKGKYPVLRVGNFYTNDKWFYSDLELSEKLYANKGDLLYTWSATFGPHIWKGDKVIYHYHIWKIIFSSEVSKQFALQMLLNDKEELMNNTNGSTMIHLTKNEMEKKVVKIPIKQEQQKIGNLLSKVDQLIELENKKLQNLQQAKKCLLQNMFVE